MADLDPVALPTLAALVGATVFSTTFLTTRVHRERGRAIDRALKLDELVAEARASDKELDADWFDEQRHALEAALRDRLDFLILGMNAGLAAATLALAIAFGEDAETDWGSPRGWGLTAFAATALVVVIVGAVDVRRARREIRRRLDETTGGQIAIAERHFHRLGSDPERAELQAARIAASEAVRASRGVYGPAWAMLGQIELASLSRPSEPDHLLRAGKALDRATTVGPETAAMQAARAVVHEEWGDFGRATAAWVRALELYVGAATAELRPDDTTVQDARTRARIAGTEITYGWKFRPRRPETLVPALEQLPAVDLAAVATAERLATAGAEADAALATAGLEAWLDRILAEPGGELVVPVYARRLADATRSAEVEDFVARYVGPDGPVERARAEEDERRAAADARQEALSESMAATQRRMSQIVEEHNAAMELRLAEMRERAERFERIRAGVPTPEDLAHRERILEEALAVTPEERERELQELEAEAHEFEAKRIAGEERQRAQDEEFARMREEVERWHRMSTGRATEEDLELEASRREGGAPG